jgi:F420-dependent oxidoreductase-like protein
VKLGIPLGWPQDATAIAGEVERVARLADAGGIDSIWTADHLFQIPVTKLPREAPMLECYSALAHVAAITTRVKIGALVTCVMYRHPGMLLKQMTSLDVLSRGRTVFGVGVGWDAEEAEALGLPFAPVPERFERLEELLQLAHRMWSSDESRFDGQHYTLGRPLNSPNSLQRPHPPILVAGGGERHTLRLVAQYADACNFFDLPAPYGVDIGHKLEVLRSHCDAVGRDFATIEKTVFTQFDGDADVLLEHFAELHEIGIDHVVVSGPEFEWRAELDALLTIVEPVHAL